MNWSASESQWVLEPSHPLQTNVKQLTSAVRGGKVLRPCMVIECQSSLTPHEQFHCYSFQCFQIYHFRPRWSVTQTLNHLLFGPARTVLRHLLCLHIGSLSQGVHCVISKLDIPISQKRLVKFYQVRMQNSYSFTNTLLI